MNNGVHVRTSLCILLHTLQEHSRIRRCGHLDDKSYILCSAHLCMKCSILLASGQAFEVVATSQAGSVEVFKTR